jgi:hypothetical protein
MTDQQKKLIVKGEICRIFEILQSTAERCISTMDVSKASEEELKFNALVIIGEIVTHASVGYQKTVEELRSKVKES